MLFWQRIQEGGTELQGIKANFGQHIAFLSTSFMAGKIKREELFHTDKTRLCPRSYICCGIGLLCAPFEGRMSCVWWCFWTSVKGRRICKCYETLVQNNGWGMSACLWIQLLLCLFLCEELGTFHLSCVSLADSEGPSTSCNEFYNINSSLLYSPDFCRCSLKNCIRDFMIFRAVRVLLSFPLCG